MNVKTLFEYVFFSVFREFVVECKNPWAISKNKLPIVCGNTQKTKS
jgi:hypothetical protein